MIIIMLKHASNTFDTYFQQYNMTKALVQLLTVSITFCLNHCILIRDTSYGLIRHYQSICLFKVPNSSSRNTFSFFNFPHHSPLIYRFPFKVSICLQYSCHSNANNELKKASFKIVLGHFTNFKHYNVLHIKKHNKRKVCFYYHTEKKKLFLL